MKKMPNKRLILEREVVKALVVELGDERLRYVNGARAADSSGAACGCLSAELSSCPFH